MKIEEIEDCFGINTVNEVLEMADKWENKNELINYLKNNGLGWDSDCLEMLIKYKFILAKL